MDNNKDFEKVVLGLSVFFIATILLPATILYFVRKNRQIELYPKKLQHRILSSISLLLPLILLKFFKYHNTIIHNLTLLLIFWTAILAISFLIVPLINIKSENITTKLLKKHKNPIKPIKDPRNEKSAYFAESMVTGLPLFLENKMRVMHTMVVGATGSGKTTLLDTLFEYDCKNKTPIIVIDPKGNDETIDKLKLKLKKYNIPESKFKIFSLAKPQESCGYNPLKYGTPIQIKDRLMGALTWSEPYYKTQADLFLIKALEIYHALNIETNIKRLLNLIESKDEKLDLKDLIKKAKLDPNLEIKITDNINSLMKINPSDLSGLHAQLNSFNPIELNGILSPDETMLNKIDLLEALNNSEILYFSLNVMNYGQTAPIVGKLLLQELKSLASQFHSKAVTSNYSFLGLYIDEAASYLTLEYIEFLKMCRDVKFANHLFFQSMADLDVISPQFKEQVQSNCITKVIMRTDSPTEAEFFASVAGTVETIEQSYQVEGTGFMTVKTGMGNQRESAKMRVAHDVFKELAIGQAVVIQKSPHKVDLVNLYRSE